LRVKESQQSKFIEANSKVGEDVFGDGFTDFDDYLLQEWILFEKDDSRQSILLDAAATLKINRVLDIGCGAGQELLPFVRQGATGIGIDLMPHSARVGYAMFEKQGFKDKVFFLRGSGENLPFAENSFDVLICRIALMYMQVKPAVKEFARVLRTGGILFLKIHSPAYYWDKFSDGLKKRHFLSSIHAARVLAAGNWYLTTGQQPSNRLTAGGEVFHTRKTLQREFQKFNLEIISELPDTNTLTPSFALEKK
jgi:ubiquinone/menaquinone biosynthesis C-methylase UbiE